MLDDTAITMSYPGTYRQAHYGPVYPMNALIAALVILIVIAMAVCIVSKITKAVVGRKTEDCPD